MSTSKQKSLRQQARDEYNDSVRHLSALGIPGLKELPVVVSQMSKCAYCGEPVKQAYVHPDREAHGLFVEVVGEMEPGASEACSRECWLEIMECGYSWWNDATGP
jgi:hypothetical protein